MTTRLQTARQDARRDLHQEMAVPALLIIGSADPVDVTVRIHERSMLVGDIPGMDTAKMHDTELHLRFWLDELDGVPPRNTTVSVADGEAYRLAEAEKPYRGTVDVSATRLSVAEAASLPLPA
jgi:hypothetical protein